MNIASAREIVDSADLDSAGKWLEKLARLGYASRGVIYFIIGGLALLAAFGQGGETTNAEGAIASTLQAPGGWVLTAFLALGLLGYAIWRFCQGVWDVDGHGKDAKAWGIRGAMVASSLTHLGLALWAAKLTIGSAAQSDSGSSKSSLVADIMSYPFGQVAVGIGGLILVGAGLAQFSKGHGEKFEKYFKWNASQRRKLMPICKFGLYARGVIFAIIGGFVIYAAWTTDPSQAGGLQDALQWLRSQPFGPYLLGIVAAGLICFGVYSMVAAIYRRIQVST